LAAVTLDCALGILVATDAGAASGLASWGVVGSVAMLAVSLGAGSSAALRASVVASGLVLLLRRDDRLVLAPLYGAALLVLVELARTCHELQSMDLVSRGAVRGRLLTILIFAGLGTCVAGLAAIAVTAAPARSVVITALGTAAVAIAFAGIVLIARHNQLGESSGDAAKAKRQPAEQTQPGDGRSLGG
jgi:hypothetical protein